MLASKPIIGISGGIGSGKSFVAGLFGEYGCAVIRADDQVAAAYSQADVKDTLKNWWGDVFLPDGRVDRKAIAARVFNSPDQLRRLEQLLHPLVTEARDAEMLNAASDAKIAGFVWDIPLLFETGLAPQCDALVFVDAPQSSRLARVRQSRGWNEEELARRENLQWPLDKKREMSQYTIDNTADADYARGQVRDVLSRILART